MQLGRIGSVHIHHKFCFMWIVFVKIGIALVWGTLCFKCQM